MSEIDDLLKKRNWEEASILILNELEDNIINDKERKNLIYNLLVCFIKLKDPSQSQEYLNKYQNKLDENTIKSFQKEIYILPTNLDENQVKSIEWFTSNINLKDVIGLDKVKKNITKKIIYPIKYIKRFREYGLSGGGGFVLYGPPGTGKTLLAKAIAGETGIRMLIANIHQMVSKYQGESAKNLHTIFEQARNGGPAIIFFDELDSLATNRNISNVSSTGGEDRRIVDTLLTELDGARKVNKEVYVIGATNVPWDIDSALMRPGRFNSFIYVNPPNFKERKKIFEYYLNKLKINKINYTKLSLLTFAFAPAHITEVCKDAGMQKNVNAINKHKKKTDPLTTKDLINAIKRQSSAPLLKEYRKALEKIKSMPLEERKQYNALIKDIKFYNKKGKQTSKLFNLLAKFI